MHVNERWMAVGAASALAMLALAACAGRRIEGGVFHSSKGYRVAIPGPEWAIVESSGADLELRHRDGAAGILANAGCSDGIARRPAIRLSTHLLAGLKGRTVLERGEVALAGRPAAHAVVEARVDAAAAPVRIETYTLNDGRCVYDLVYAADVSAFADRRPDFTRFLSSFSME